MFEVELHGCAPTPLASYLKALGILRLVAEQADPEARGCWQGSHFVLRSNLDQEALIGFFLNDYAPTPIIAPWNGGSGFYPGDNTSGIDPLSRTASPRFGEYATSIKAARTALDILKLEASPKKEAKDTFLNRLRGVLPDSALRWFDAAVLLANDQALYPPLLGTGGNDGRLDFTNNFMQRVVALFDVPTGSAKAEADGFLIASLLGEPVMGLMTVAVGQFAPGAAGGPNATSGFEGESKVNPWDFVLMIEGAIAFSAAATRRSENDRAGALSYPFTVYPTAAGSGHTALADEGSSRAELWMPLWSRPARYDEIRVLFSEARVTLGRRPARNGLDFVRAVSALSVDRGIDSFQRFGLMMRSGKAFLATPMGAVHVARNARADLIDKLDTDGWLESFRRFARGSEAPARLKGIARRLDEALFEMATPRGNHGGQRPPAVLVQAALIALGEALTYLAHSPKGRDAVRRLPWLTKDWVGEADDGSDEFQLAAAIASIRNEDRNIPPWPMLCHLAPVTDDGRKWADEAQQRVVWGEGALVDNLRAVLRRRLVDAERHGLTDKPLGGRCGADCAAIAAFLAGDTDDRRIDALVRGLVLAEMPNGLRREGGGHASPIPAAYARLKPLFTPDAVLKKTLPFLAEDTALPIPRDLVGKLMSGQIDSVESAIESARRRARASGLIPLFKGMSGLTIDGRRLAAALLIPITERALCAEIDRVYRSDNSPEETQSTAPAHEHERGIAP